MGNRCDRRRSIKDKALEVASKYLVGDCFDPFSNAFKFGEILVAVVVVVFFSDY